MKAILNIRNLIIQLALAGLLILISFMLIRVLSEVYMKAEGDRLKEFK